MLAFKTNTHYPSSMELLNEGKYMEAIHDAQQKLLKAKANQSTRLMLDAYVELYYCYINELLLDKAFQIFYAHEQLYKKTAEPLDAMHHYIMSYIYYDVHKQYDEGIATLKKAIPIAFAHDQKHFVAICYCYIGSLYTRKKQYDQAIAHAHLGMTFMQTTKKPLMIHRLHCELSLCQIYISAAKFEKAEHVLQQLAQSEQLLQHHTLYMQYLFFQLRYLYVTNQMDVARTFRQQLIRFINTADNYVAAALLIPLIKRSLQQADELQELAIWQHYEEQLTIFLQDTVTPLLQNFSSAQEMMALDDILPKSLFFEQAAQIYNRFTQTLTLVVFQITESTHTFEHHNSFVRFYFMQQALQQVLATFPKKPLLRGHLAHNKFALLFDHEETKQLIQPLQQLNRSITVHVFAKQYTAPFHFVLVNTLMSRTSSFLELYHIAEARLYYSLFD